MQQPNDIENVEADDKGVEQFLSLSRKSGKQESHQEGTKSAISAAVTFCFKSHLNNKYRNLFWQFFPS